MVIRGVQGGRSPPCQAYIRHFLKLWPITSICGFGPGQPPLLLNASLYFSLNIRFDTSGPNS